jgi:hypothetical protein
MSRTQGAARNVVSLGRSLVATVLCVETAHAVVYGSIFPDDGEHGYFTWFIPVVGALSFAALAITPILLAVGRVSGRRVSLAGILPVRRRGDAPRAVARLALSAAALFVLQESLERTAATGALRFGSFSALDLLVAAIALVCAAATVVAIQRTLDCLGERPEPSARAAFRVEQRPATPASSSRPRPQSVYGGLRGPPLTA